MSQDLRLRHLTPDDAVALQQACWPELTPDQARLRLDHFLNRHRRGHGWGLVAVTYGQVIGFGQLLRWGSVHEICDLIVAEAWRGQGIGTRIIHTLLDMARQAGVGRVEIGGTASNERALALYRRLGFHERGRVEMDVGSGLEPIIYLELRLEQPERA